MNEDACEQFRGQMGRYLYGELAETAAPDRHLEECSACRQELEATKRALAAVDRAGLGSAPEGVVDAVISGVIAELRRSPRRLASRRWLRAVASLAACLLVGALGTWIFVLSDGKEPPSLSNRQLELEAQAVVAEAQSVLGLLDELEGEDDILVRLLGQDAAGVPNIEPDSKKEDKEPA